MTPQIFTGFDCRKDYKYPTRKPRIYPRNITLNTGENINLYLRTTHPQCDPACYTWKILAGGGYLVGDFGIENIYYAPSDNDLCEANPNIEVSAGRTVLDTISIGVTGLSKPVPAALKALDWIQPEVEIEHFFPHLVGLPYCIKDPRLHYWTLRIDEYGCDGSRINRHQIGLFTSLLEARWCIAIRRDYYIQLRLIGEQLQHHGYPQYGTLDDVKQRILRYWKEDYLFWLPQLLHGKHGIEGARWPKGKGFPLYPGTTLDVRMDKVIEMDCCPHLIAELQHPET